MPSLRIDAFSLDVMSKVQDVRKSSLTFAPEAGTQRMRDVINKGLTEEVILHGAMEAFKGGWIVSTSSLNGAWMKMSNQDRLAP